MVAVEGEPPSRGLVGHIALHGEAVFVVDETEVRTQCQLKDAFGHQCDALTEVAVIEAAFLQHLTGFELDPAQA